MGIIGSAAQAVTLKEVDGRTGMEQLEREARQYGIVLTAEQNRLFSLYSSLLLDWNSRMNLTAITKKSEIIIKHFLDCLLIEKVIPLAGELIDVGSGAGFPGVPLKIVQQQLSLTLLEANGKKQRFLSALLETLGLQARQIQGRAEEVGRKQEREKYDIATSRAVATLPVLCEYCLPLVKVGGCFVAMKGADAAKEIKQAAKAAHTLGAALESQQEMALPDGSKRCLLVYRKNSPTPARYPRNAAAIKKAPIGL